MRWLLLITGLVIFGAACAHTPECRERIDNCLRRCPPDPPSTDRRADSAVGGVDFIDRRSDCERSCQSICMPSAQRKAQPISPASSPTSPPESSPGPTPTPDPAPSPDPAPTP